MQGVLGILILICTLTTNVYCQGHTSFEHEKANEQDVIISSYQRKAEIFYKTNLDSAIFVFQELKAKGLDLNDDHIIGYALTSMAYLSKLQNRNKTEIAFYKEALNYSSHSQQLQCEIFNNLGTAYFAAGKLDSAETMFRRSREKYSGLEDTTFYVNLLINEGNVYNTKEQYHTALNKYLEALNFAVQSKQPMKEVIAIGKIGLLYYQIADTLNALYYLQECLNKSKNNNYTRLKWDVLLKLGLVYMNQNQYEKSINCFEEVLQNGNSINFEKEVFIASSSMAYIYIQLMDRNKAKRFIDQAKLLENKIELDKDKILFYQAKALWYQLGNDLDNCRKMYQEIIDIGTKYSSPKIQITGFNGLLVLAELEKEWEKASVLSKKIIAAYDQINVQSQLNLIYDLETKYKVKQKDLEIDNLQKNSVLQKEVISQQKRLNMLYLLALLLTILLLSAFIYNHFKGKRMNALLEIRNEQLSKALLTNKALLKEIHHRVKNNLQVVSSLLGLQGMYIKDEEGRKAIKTGRSRVQSISLLHQKLYQGENIQHVNVKDYFENLVSNLISTYQINSNKIQLCIEVEEMTLDIDTVVHMGLIINELISNALKYAYIDNKILHLDLSIKENNGFINMLVKDNGVGLPFNVIPEKTNTLGMQLIKSFVNKLNGDIHISNINGVAIEISFHLPNHESTSMINT